MSDSKDKNHHIEDWRKKDGKEIPGESSYYSSVLIASALSFVGLPVSIGLLYPAAFVYHVTNSTSRLLQGKSIIDLTPWPPTAVLEPINLNKERIPFDQRKYDIVLFGVTGFTGGLAAKYIAKQYGNSVKWAIAGRRKDALEKIRNELTSICSDLKDLPLIVAKSDDPASLDEMVKDTRVIITTVGPFALYGTPLVKAAIERGTSYCDITGEADWCEILIDHYDNAARQTGSCIVNMTGHDCIPWDILTLKCAEHIRSNDADEELSEILFYDEVNAGPSGGTLATAVESFPPKVYKSPFRDFSPYVMDAEGKKSPYKTINQVQLGPGLSNPKGSYSSYFIMSMVMYKCVQRSNALNGYGKQVVYKEAEVVPNFPSLLNKYLTLPVLGAVLALPPLRERVLPKPGEGPSEQQLKKGFLQLTCFAQGNKGTKVKAGIYFNVDPGYQDTARMIVESGLCIALNRDKLKCGPNGGGILTPASCQGSALLDRLIQTGCKFDIKKID